MGYFGAWDGSHVNSWGGWDGFAGNMGLLTAHPGKANASADAVDASSPSDVAFQNVTNRTFRPCKDFDLQLHEAMRRPPAVNAFSALQTDDGEEMDEPVATDPHLKPKSCSTP